METGITSLTVYRGEDKPSLTSRLSWQSADARTAAVSIRQIPRKPNMLTATNVSCSLPK